MKWNEIRTGVTVSFIISCRFNVQQNTFQSRKMHSSNLIDVLLILCLLNAFFMGRAETPWGGVFGEGVIHPSSLKKVYLVGQIIAIRRTNFEN